MLFHAVASGTKTEVDIVAAKAVKPKRPIKIKGARAHNWLEDARKKNVQKTGSSQSTARSGDPATADRDPNLD